jgi:hypothetical protein
MNAQRRILGPSAEVVALITRFGREKGPQRVEALQALQQRGNAGTEDILALLSREETNRSLLYRFGGIGVTAAVVGIALCGNAAVHSRAFIPFVFLFLLGWCGATLTIGKSFMQTKAEKYAKAALVCMYETLDDPRTVGPLLESYGEFLDPNLNAWNELALTRLLSRFGKADAGLLNMKQRTALRKILEKTTAASNPPDWRDLTEEHTQFLEAILATAQFVGDTDTLAQVKRLAGTPTQTPEQQRVVAAAQRILPRLQERLKKPRR